MMVGVSMSDFKKYLIPGHHCDTFVNGIVHKNSDSIGRQGNAIGSDEAGKSVKNTENGDILIFHHVYWNISIED